MLQHSDWGETDRILTLYTREKGKVRAIAKGVRKPRSRKAGHLEPFTRASLQLHTGRDLFILTQAEALETFNTIRDDLILMGYAAYLVELLNRFTYDDGENPSLYRLLTASLARLNRGDDPDLVIRYYEIRLLDYAGYRPQLFECTQCEAEIQPEDQFFSALQGGVICPKCGKTAPDSRPIAMDTLKYLRHFQRSSYQDAQRARLTATLNANIEHIIHFYLTHILERGLNTPGFIQKMKQARVLSEQDQAESV